MLAELSPTYHIACCMWSCRLARARWSACSLRGDFQSYFQGPHLNAVHPVAELPVILLAGPAAVPRHLAARAPQQLHIPFGDFAGCAVAQEDACVLHRLQSTAFGCFAQGEAHAECPGVGAHAGAWKECHTQAISVNRSCSAMYCNCDRRPYSAGGMENPTRGG